MLAAGFILDEERVTELVVFGIFLCFRGDGGALDLDLLVGVVVLDLGGLLHGSDLFIGLDLNS